MRSHALTGGGTIRHFDTGPFNWYLIEEHGQLTLVDAGFPGHYAVLRRGLDAIGRSIKDIAAVVITHAHADHMGIAERVRQESGAPLYIHAADMEAAKHARVLPWYGLLSNAWRPYMRGMLAHATLNGVFWQRPITRLEPMSDGQTLDVPGRPHVLHVPGHTAGQIALFLPESRILFSSDTLVTRHLLNGRPCAPQVISPVLTDDTPQAYASLDRLRNLGTVTMLPGHGAAWQGDMASAVDAARRARPPRP